MNEEWVQMLVAWLPLLVFLALFVVFARRAGLKARAPSGRTMIDLYEEQVIEARRTNELLARIAVVLEQRGQK